MFVSPCAGGAAISSRPMRASMSGSDPLVAGIGDTDLIPNEGALVEVTAAPGRSVPLTLIPPVIAHSGATISIPGVQRDPRDHRCAGCRSRHARKGPHRLFRQSDGRAVLSLRLSRPGPRARECGAPRARRRAQPSKSTRRNSSTSCLMCSRGASSCILINFPVAKQLSTGWRHAGRTIVPLRDVPVRVKLSARRAHARGARGIERNGHRLRARGRIGLRDGARARRSRDYNFRTGMRGRNPMKTLTVLEFASLCR